MNAKDSEVWTAQTGSATRNDKSDGFDLLRVGPIRSLVLWLGFPYVFQALMLLFFVMLAVIGWGQYAPAGVKDKLYAKSHLATLLIWGLWWPTMVWIAVFFGRAWCAICPLELVSNVSERLGRRLGIRQRPLRRWILSGGIIVGFYALLQLLAAGAHIHRVPAYTSLFLIGLLALALLTGLIFKDRAFCRGFCPVGQLLATYGRGSMLVVRAGSAQTCADCAGKDCIVACNRTRLDARSCPSLLNVPKLNSNRDCLVCGQCIKSCQPNNVRLLLRRPFHPADAREPLSDLPTTVFVMLVSGFVTWELLTEWHRGEEVFLMLPQWVSQQIGLPWLSGYLNGIWALVVVPLVIWTVMAGVVRLFGGSSTISQTWRRLALPIAAVVAAGHITKGLAKFVSWAGFLPYALKDPVGTKTVLDVNHQTIPQPGPLLSLPVVAGVGIVLVLIGLSFAIRESRLAHPETKAHHRTLIPQLGLAAAFLCIICGWVFASKG